MGSGREGLADGAGAAGAAVAVADVVVGSEVDLGAITCRLEAVVVAGISSRPRISERSTTSLDIDSFFILA